MRTFEYPADKLGNRRVALRQTNPNGSSYWLGLKVRQIGHERKVTNPYYINTKSITKWHKFDEICEILQEAPAQSPKPVMVNPVRILSTRIQPPESPVAVLARPRLHSPHPVRLTLVVAAAGMGKSTLVAGQPSAWLSLTNSDGDLHTFVTYFLESLARFNPCICPSSRSMMLGQASTESVPTGLPTLLVNELLDFGQEVQVVLDDLHLCFGPEVRDFLEFLLRFGPGNFSLKVTSRQHLDLPLGWLRARGLLHCIEERDLAFSLDEAGQLIREVWGLAVSDVLLEVLWNKTEGWVTALQLATQTLRSRPNHQWEDYLRGLTGTQHEIYEYLAGEVLATLPSNIQAFVRTVSSMEEWTLQAAAAVSGQDAVACVAYLRRHRLFLEHLTERGYRFHPLFREFLWAQVQVTGGGAEVDQRASDFWLRQGLPERAALHRSRLGTLDCLLESHGMELLLRGWQNQVAHWLQQIPLARRQSSPSLSILAGSLCELQGHWPEAESHYLRALRLGEAGAAWAHLCQGYLKCDRHQELLTACSRALAAHPEPAVKAQLLAWRGATLVQTGQDWSQGYADILESQDLSRQLPCPHAQFAVSVAYALGYLFPRGEMREALRFLEEQSDQFLARGQPLPAYFLAMNRALILLTSGEPRASLKLVEDTLLESRRAGHIFVYQGLETLKLLIMLQEERDDWGTTPDVDAFSPQFRPALLTGLLRHFLRLGQTEAAAPLARRLQGLDPGLYALEGNLALAEWYRARGQEEEATACLQANLALCKRAQSPFWEARTRRRIKQRPGPGLSIYCLGPLRVYHKGVELSSQLTQIPLKILSLLVAGGRSFVPVERILDAIWPDFDHWRSRRSFSVHLVRLRKLLGRSQAIVRKGDCLRLDLSSDLEVDALAFEDLCRQAREFHRQGDNLALQEVAGRALALWQGSFFEELPYLDGLDWQRQRLDAEYAWLQQWQSSQLGFTEPSTPSP